MLSLLPIFSLAQAFPVPTSTPSPIPLPIQKQVVQPQEIRALPGQLDKVPMFNSNSPEVIQTEGILLSTFPPTGKTTPTAHLNYELAGRFDLFSHHIARPNKPGDDRPLYQAVIVYNPGHKPVTLNILQAVSYATNPDAPFVELPPYLDNSSGTIYAGPGSRVMSDILRGVHQADFPSQLVIFPKQSQILFSLPITRANCRSTFMRLQSSEPVYLASLAMYARPNPIARKGKNLEDSLTPPPQLYRAPTLPEWLQLLNRGNLAGPRDRVPTPPSKNGGDIVYGRVAGVAQGSEWRSEIADRSGDVDLSIPPAGKAFSYPIGTVPMITFGTRQVQSAPMLVRYADTAYSAHGNYGVYYSLTLPLSNKTGQTQTVIVKIQTPLKQEDRGEGLRFLNPPDPQVFFRGTVRVSYKDDSGVLQARYIHLVQRRGQQGEPLITLNMPPRDHRLVKIEFLYPPDATPPQVLTVRTLERSR
ncbi:MAG TPA: DUF3370 domain-containing protein [Waterburya sp.]|jgi:hypothetical protein